MGRTSVIGRPSSQCACRGQAATTRSKTAGFRMAFSGVSRVGPNTVSDQVSLSPSRVRMEKLPIGVSGGPARGGGVGPREVARVVEETAHVGLDLRRPRSEGSQPVQRRRAPPHRIHDQIGGDLFAGGPPPPPHGRGARGRGPPPPEPRGPAPPAGGAPPPPPRR